MLRKYIFSLVLIVFYFGLANCHGRLLVPPARSSAWREDPIKFPIYYDDNQMFCGGAYVQWTENNGLCGICGDNYKGDRQFEKGGSLYRGFIVRKYKQGETIDVTVQITANHLGFFEFKLCNIDNRTEDATQECLDRTLLTNSRGNTRIAIGRLEGKLKMKIVLPRNFTCNHCVFQWKYNTQNSWGKDKVSGRSCIGCGSQEEFYGCADISIL